MQPYKRDTKRPGKGGAGAGEGAGTEAEAEAEAGRRTARRQLSAPSWALASRHPSQATLCSAIPACLRCRPTDTTVDTVQCSTTHIHADKCDHASTATAIA